MSIQTVGPGGLLYTTSAALAGGHFGFSSGAITVVAAGSTLLALRNNTVAAIAVRRIGIGFITTTGFTAAQPVDFEVRIARGFTAMDTGGSTGAGWQLTNSNKIRTDMLAFPALDVQIATVAALTPGVRTVDSNAVGIVAGFAAAVTAGVTILPEPNNIFGRRDSDIPITLLQNEGILIRNITAFGAAGVGTLYVNFAANQIPLNN